jgi:type 1 fimbria pilin
MKNSLLLGFFVTFLSFEIHACYVNSNETPNFNLSNLGSFKTNANNQRITATVNPDRYGTIFNRCNGSGSNLFQIQGTANLGISTTEAINLNGRRYFKITKSPSSIPANPAIIYIAFSVQDNQDTATPFAVNDSNTSYSMYRGTSDTRGIRLLNVSILVQGTNLTPGTYNISNIILGTFTGTSDSRSPSRPINILNLAYTITASTCTVENTNVNLPSMRFSDFSSIGTSKGTTDFSIDAKCLDDAVNTSYSATISDNFAPTTTNLNGTLVNSISSGSGGSNIKIRLTDASNAPIAIGPLNLNNKFTFGTLNSSKSVSKALKASYYAETVPVTPGIVKSIATVNLIYD